MAITYLGRVQAIRTSSEGYRFAHIQPLLRSEDGRGWRKFSRPVSEEFPSRGFVFWHDAPATLTKDSYWQFRIVEHPYYDGVEKLEKYQVDQPQPAIEVIDLRGYGEAIIRRLLTTEGLPLRRDPIGPDVLIWVEDDKWVGPVQVFRAPRGWKIKETENLTRIQCWRPPLSEAFKVDLAGERILLNSRRDFGEAAGFCNWLSDYDFARGILRRLRKLDRYAFDGMNVTYAVFDEYLRALEDAGLTGTDLEQELGRRERVHELRATIERNASLLSEAVSVLYESSQVKEELEKRKEEEYRRLRTELEERLNSELAERRAVLLQLEHDIAKARGELDRLNQEIDEREKELDARVGAFEDALARRLNRLVEAPEQAFAELALFRTVFGPGSAARPDRAAPAPRNVDPPPSDARRIAGTAELIKVLGDKLAARGASPLMVADLHAAFLAGAVPIVTGSMAYEVLDAYAATVTGGRLYWIPISGAIFEPQELLGRFDPASRRIIPHPGGLLDVLIEASESDRLYLVVLEGLNRAPVESYLLPLLESFSDAYLGRRLRTIPLAPRVALDPADPYNEWCHVAWQPNVLLAATPVLGAATLPLPKAIWDHAVLIDCDRYELLLGGGLPATAPGEQPGACEVAYAQWADFRNACCTGVTPISGAATGQFEHLRSLVRQYPVATRLYAAARSSGMSEESALSLATKLSLIPRLTDREAEVVELFAGRGPLDDRDIEAIIELGRRLMGDETTH